MGARHRFVSTAVNPLIPVKIGFLIFLALSGSLLGFSAASIAGPKDNLDDTCLVKYYYEFENAPENKISKRRIERYCVTKKGRVLFVSSSLEGYLGKDYTSYIASQAGGTYWTVRFEQVNQGRALVRYACTSDYKGTCQGPTEKDVYKYLDPNE
jgi:hypothetical protein